MDLFLYIILFTSVNLCFTEELEVEERIRNGFYAKIEDFPHVAALETLFGYHLWGVNIGVWYYTCGGAIVAEKWIITSQHCIDSYFTNFRFVIGTDYVSIIWENSDNIKYVDTFFLVETDSVGFLPYDHDSPVLARVTSPITFNSRTKKIEFALFSPEDDYRIVNATIAGWGRSSFSRWTYRSFYLRYTNVTMIKTSHPSNILTRGVTNFTGACLGDSGSALIVYRNGENLLHGVLFGGERFYPPGFECVQNYHARINFYYKWIYETMHYN